MKRRLAVVMAALLALQSPAQSVNANASVSDSSGLTEAGSNSESGERTNGGDVEEKKTESGSEADTGDRDEETAGGGADSGSEEESGAGGSTDSEDNEGNESVGSGTDSGSEEESGAGGNTGSEGDEGNESGGSGTDIGVEEGIGSEGEEESGSGGNTGSEGDEGNESGGSGPDTGAEGGSEGEEGSGAGGNTAGGDAEGNGDHTDSDTVGIPGTGTGEVNPGAEKDKNETKPDSQPPAVQPGGAAVSPAVENPELKNQKQEMEREGAGTGWLRLNLKGVTEARESEWTLELQPSRDGESLEAIVYQITLPEMNDGQYGTEEYVIEDIPNGQYQLSLTPFEGDGSSYIPYEQKNIKIDSDITTLFFINDLPENQGYEGASAGVGVLSMGDINGDGKVDDKDKDELLKLVSMTELHDDAFSDRADLNGDGTVDLLDVAQFTKYYKTGAGERLARPQKTLLIREDEITASVSNASRQEGSAESVFAGTGSLTMECDGVITANNMVELSGEFEEARTMAGFVIEPVLGSGGSIRNAIIIVEPEGENKTPMEFQVIDGIARRSGTRARSALFRAASRTVTGNEDSMLQGLPIVIDLGGQVAVKRITIKVSSTLDQKGLTDISRVEFLNNMADRIPEPELCIPDRLYVEDGDASFTLSWRKQPNVTGYEVTVTDQDGSSQVYPVENTTSLSVSSINGSDLINGEEYAVTVRSVNGAWRSRSSETVTARPRAAALPPAPENITITGGYKRLSIGWKDMKDTDTYTLYYRKAADTAADYQSIEGIVENSYDLRDLEDVTRYEIYLTGTNPLGEGPKSLTYTGTTASLDPPVTPNYRLINTPEGNRTAHVESVLYGGTEGHEFDVVDNNYITSWVRNDWDAGLSYPAENKSPIVTLDGEYEMDTIALIPDEEQKYPLKGAVIYYWNSQGQKASMQTTVTRKTSNNKAYYMVQAKEPFTAARVQLAIGNTYGSEHRISIAELKFYYYDSLERDIMGLYADSYHVSLRDNVNQSEIDGLRERLNTPDEVSGEFHPKSEILEAELANAEKILAEGSADDEVVKVDSKDTERADSHITFRGGLNAYQPLGVAAMAGDTVTVYVGGPKHNVGDGTRLQLITAQYHGSSAAVFKSAGYLKAGPNEITIEAVDNMDLERGGQLYVAYTGSAGAEEYGIRVVGGTKVPVLDLSDYSLRTLEDPMADEECSRKLTAYVEALEEMSARIGTLHNEEHGSYDWDPKNCICEATDIVTRYSMLSLATDQVLAGLGSGSTEDKAQVLAQSLKAMDEMMYLFYQHKGLSEDPGAPGYNRVPVSRINIRYQRMFAGAFMYAGGRHIGIEWAQLPGMVNGRPVQADENGKWVSGRYFGWGIAHEIGHEINEGAYAVAEITNNYFSLLAQAQDNNDSVRFRYPDVFKKVTSGTKGKASNVFVQLAMYWQLHLAYDRGYNFKIYDTNAEQLENLFFARVDSYVRKPDKAPGSLSLSGADTDNKLMRLAMAASEKNLLEFFRHWGMEPDEGTIAYASGFEKETRGIWFANDEIRAAQIEGGSSQNPAAGMQVQGIVDYITGSNQVTLDLSSTSDIWIYEICRYERIKDQIERKTVGYAQADGSGDARFTDTIGTINNHTFTYEVIGYDQWLNPTEKAEIGSVKVSHDGSLDKSLWQVTTNLANDDLAESDEDNPDVQEQIGLELMIDDDASTGFTGQTDAGVTPEIILHLNQDEVVTGLVYTAGSGTGIKDFQIYVSENGTRWTRVKTADTGFQTTDQAQTIYFRDEKNLYTYNAAYVKLTAPGQGGKELTVSELSLLGQTGDNLVFEETESMGILSADYMDNGEVLIPKGSLVFTGRYKGNPAYNTVLLWDENGRIVGGLDSEGSICAKQVIFAPDPENGMLGEVSDGIWVYYIEPGFDVSSVSSGKVRGELYRVDDAQTQEGERLVSSTTFVEVPAQLPSITLNKGGGQ